MECKSEVMNISPRTGRPTDNPKRTQVVVRFDDETLNTLDEFCKKERVGRAEGVRKGVKRLEKPKK